MTLAETFLGAKWQALAKEILATWKANEVELAAKFGTLRDYTVSREIEALWQIEEVKKEFGHDFQAFKAYLLNEGSVSFYKSKSTDLTREYNRAANIDDNADDRQLREKFEADAVLRKEFGGDFDCYRAWYHNQSNVKNYYTK